MTGLYYLPLGGAAEIGMNMYLYGIGPRDNIRWIMVDCGIGFPDAAQVPGVETMTVDPSFIQERRDALEGIVITHAHEDHIGGIGWLHERLKAQIHCTAFPAEIGRRKLEEHRISPKLIVEHAPNTPFDLGPFNLSLFPMTHSVPETSALIIRTEFGTIFHTADFKIDEDPIYAEPMDKAALQALGDEGVLALVCDSTNVFDEGHTRGEKALIEPLRAAIKGRTGKIAATTFASNVPRLKTLAEAAKAEGRAVVMAGRAMQRMLEAGVRTGVVTDFPELTTQDEAEDVPDEHLFYLVTGSQGEGRAAIARIAGNSHPAVSLSEGDTVLFSSKTIPGNEPDVARIHNMLIERGIEVVDSDQADIHVSGHAKQDELAELYRLLRPKIGVPMHGERRHLREHARLAPGWGCEEAHIVTNGEMLQLAPTTGIVDDVPTGRLYRDGDLTVGAMDGVVRARRKMALNGLLAISVIVDEDGIPAVETDVRASGAPEAIAGKDSSFEEQIADAIDDALDSMPRKQRLNDEYIEEQVGIIARRTASKLWGKKPQTIVFMTRLEDD